MYACMKYSLFIDEKREFQPVVIGEDSGGSETRYRDRDS